VFRFVHTKWKLKLLSVNAIVEVSTHPSGVLMTEINTTQCFCYLCLEELDWWLYHAVSRHRPCSSNSWDNFAFFTRWRLILTLCAIVMPGERNYINKWKRHWTDWGPCTGRRLQLSFFNK